VLLVDLELRLSTFNEFYNEIQQTQGIKVLFRNQCKTNTQQEKIFLQLYINTNDINDASR